MALSGDNVVGTSPSVSLIVDRRSRRSSGAGLRQLWRARELLLVITIREMKLRYASSALGAFWTLFQPLILLGVYVYAFSRFHHESAGVPYVVWAVCGVALWLFIARGLTGAAVSLRSNLALVTRTSCPRPLIPVANLCASSVDLLVGVGLFVIMAAGVYGIFPTWRAAFAPVVILATFLLVLGMSFFLSVLEVQYRDVGRALPWLVQLWFFVSPVAYALPVPHAGVTQVVHGLNPAVGLLGIWRWALIGSPLPSTGDLLVTLGVTVGFLIVGFAYFVHFDRVLADDL